jgi:hypothetical protein
MWQARTTEPGADRTARPKRPTTNERPAHSLNHIEMLILLRALLFGLPLLPV